MDVLIYDRADDRFKVLRDGEESTDKQIAVVEDSIAGPFMTLQSVLCRIEVEDLGVHHKNLEQALTGITKIVGLKVIYLRRDVYGSLNRIVLCGAHNKDLALLRSIILGYSRYGCMTWYYDTLAYKFTTNPIHNDSVIPVNFTLNDNYVAKIIFVFPKAEGGVTVYGKGDAKKFCEALGSLKPHMKYEYSIVVNKEFFKRCFTNRLEYCNLSLPDFRKNYERFELMWAPWQYYFEQPARASGPIIYQHYGKKPVDLKKLKAEFLGEQGEDEMGANTTNRCINGLKIKDVTFAKNKTTVVLWSDGVRTVVRCQKGEKFDPEKGLAMAISKRFLGNERSYYHTFLHWENRYNKTKKGKKSK